MFFKSIELRGFKSFVDETKMIFDEGVTVIVGPNGCGKSNIADGLRWVLGEQSAKSMRGAKMEDFIFNGSSTRKPTGFAEVSVTISDLNGSISSQPYSEYEEIAVSRKLYRNGDSEYMINKVPCRLKDIVDIFLDTGISVRTLSIIEQEQVTRIVNSKPDDRKVFIDEAAGIMKYKQRRNSAINKLSLGQQNLLRIQDILAELERQRNSLNRQAKKAERHRVFRDEIKERGLAHFATDFQERAKSLDEYSLRLDELRQDEASLQAELSTNHNKLESLNAKISDEEKAVADIKEEKSRIESTIARNDDHRGLLSRHIEEAKLTRKNSIDEIEQVESETARNDDEINQRRVELKSIETLINAKKVEIAGLREDVDTAQSQLHDRREKLEEGSRITLGIMEEISSKKREQSSIKTKVEMAGSTINSLADKESQYSRDASSAKERSGGLGERLIHLKVGFDDETAKVNETKNRLLSVNTELSSAEGETRSLSEELAKCQSKLESLEEFERNFEGYGEGVRKLMKLKEEGAGELSGVRGLLVKGAKVAPEMEVALAATLGSRLEAVMMDNCSNMLKAITTLKKEKLGGASFVSADLAPSNGAQAPETVQHPALIGRASDLFTFTGDSPSNIKDLLSHTLVARDFTGAMEIWNLKPGGFTVVTTDGEVIDTAGFVTGGLAKTGAAGAAGIVSRKRIIEELGGRIKELREDKQTAEDKRGRLAESKLEQERKLDATRSEARRLELEIVEITNEIGKADEELKRNSAHIDSLKSEKEALIADTESLSEALNESASVIDRLNDRKNEADAQNEAMQTAIKQAGANLDVLRDQLQDKELDITESRGRHDGLNLDIKRLEGIVAGHIARVQRLKDSIGDLKRKSGEMDESIESMLSENVELAREKDSLEEKVGAMNEALAEKTGESEEIQKAIRGLQTRLNDIQPVIADVALKKSETEMRIENIIEKADTEFNIPVEDLENLDVSAIDIEEVTERLNFLRGQLSKMGDVNLGALEEFEQIDKRWQFLKTQRDDLVTSIETLHKTIESINATTNKMFTDTFEEVAKNFEATFKRLFGGGHAELKLVYEEGKPEPGVEIMAQPPGKKNQSMNLLSAGEKAMTAIALLFSVFMTKPSPFCLLDEIDAPLDEANIVRFRDMLMEMREKTQFIIITHNQKTMSFGDRLYGVTQEEEGISKILAVDLHDERAHTPSAA
ncbi:Chromosome partition protein smc [hydrothermal vent metagenome]|uniref:Chromosome partition protein smc n=1 Tax=hydrothermal vent metagenome TaxID=652676 RepID=A0A3B1CV95_9ZZZZ